MGFFDTVRDKAGAIAADAERAGKVTAAQARLVVLQSDLKKAERELGHAVFALVERGELDHPELAHAVERLRATTAEVRAKETEISALRGEQQQVATSQPSADTGPTTTVVETASGPVTVTAGETADVAEAPTDADAAASTVTDAAEGETGASAAPAEADKPAEEEPAEATPATAAGAGAKSAAGAKPKPRRRTTKGGAGASAGATPKKSGRPSSAGKGRPAGKKPEPGPG